jgi:hypothetical protein
MTDVNKRSYDELATYCQTINAAVVVTKIESPMIILELTPYQAEVLAVICQMIGGWPNGPRGVFDELDEALHNAGIHGDDAILKYQASGSLIIDDWAN